MILMFFKVRVCCVKLCGRADNGKVHTRVQPHPASAVPPPALACCALGAQLISVKG
jgi:hypothetical protein